MPGQVPICRKEHCGWLTFLKITHGLVQAWLLTLGWTIHSRTLRMGKTGRVDLPRASKRSWQGLDRYPGAPGV